MPKNRKIEELAAERKTALENSVERNVRHSGYSETLAINEGVTEYTPKPAEGSEELSKQEARRAALSRYLNELLVISGQTPVKSDEEMVYRIDSYFQRCAAIGKTPTWVTKQLQ